MKVHFIGAGPGAPDLITLRGRDLLARCPVCLYAGSLVPKELLAHCPPGARIVDTAPMTLDEIAAEFSRARDEDLDVARLHSGDLSVWSAMGEQLRRLDALGIAYDVTPGVPSFAAAAAALQRELTLPEVAQSLVLTRTSGRASAMPEKEKLAAFAATGATLAIHLSIHVLEKIVAELLPFYGPDCPIALVFRASWPDERIVQATLATIVARDARQPDGAHRADPRRAGAGRRAISARARSTIPITAAAIAAASFARTARWRTNERLSRQSIVRNPVFASRPPSRSNTTISSSLGAPCSACAAVRQARVRDGARNVEARALGDLEGVLGGIGGADGLGRFASREAREKIEIDAAALGVQIEQALRQLGHLGHAAGDDDAARRDVCADISACRRRNRPCRSAASSGRP